MLKLQRIIRNGKAKIKKIRKHVQIANEKTSDE
jgi:hypothetical protein